MPRHAVVVGAGLAGLLAARVLSDTCDQVTIVERDRLPRGPDFRPGVPQSRHLHLLLGRGRQVLEEFFPGLTGELARAGAVPLDWGRDSLFLGGWGWAPRFDSGLTLYASSRELLEWVVRTRVLARAGVRVVECAEVVATVGDASAVTGVRLRSRPGARGPVPEQLTADLVVDASGRGSPAPRWLAELGCGKVAETVVDAGVGYATRAFVRPRAVPADWQSVYVLPDPPRTVRGGALYPVEGDRWLVTLTGAGNECPPTDERGFAAFARSLRSPLIGDCIAGATPVSSVCGFRNTANRLRHFERSRPWPRGLIVVGDAACALNPVYGQGVSVAALGARCLADWLRAGAEARHFQRRLARVHAGPWGQAAALDYRYPQTSGPRPGLRTKLLQGYLDRLLPVASREPDVFMAYVRVVNMLDAPGQLLHPRVVRRVLAGPPLEVKAGRDDRCAPVPPFSIAPYSGAGRSPGSSE